MHKIRDFIGLWADKRVRFIIGTALGLIIWTFSSNSLSDIVVFSAFLYALFHTERGLSAWKQPAGYAFIIVFIHHFLMLPFSVSPEMSVHDTERIIEVLAGAFAIPVIFNDRQKIGRALLFSAVAISLTLAYDLVRMSYYLGPDIFARAHSFRPFILNHSNVASMMAGLSFFVFLFFIRQWRKQFWPTLACLGGTMVCLAYLIIAASRGPQIAFALAFACSGLILPGWRRKLIWLAVVIFLSTVLFISYQHINPRFAEKATMRGFSERDKVWDRTWQLVKERPWFGHGYGKSNFEMNYYASQPPRAKYHFPHCHQYWLKLFFEYGWVGLALYAAAWSILAFGLARQIFLSPTLEGRLLPGAIGLMLLFIHFYGLGDYPDNIVQTAQVWLIPAALVVLKRKEEKKLSDEYCA